MAVAVLVFVNRFGFCTSSQSALQGIIGIDDQSLKEKFTSSILNAGVVMTSCLPGSVAQLIQDL